ncbi:hypothetical protein AD006_01165 [Pseudonocardia sp. EC080610-09]|uniref:hypothetical protein n=1 Tax=unclassified Pseudonocardia TaxID=2619320 RepID=UPI000705C876|nr:MULTISPECIES: hypothetical protein [unclassified Pseudonocardia]ALL74276.1 hypothetical protein AD006_01165 [Pseudonocardia sp. EC080610-09]ALL81299.1 hypothetical protein AD017_08990 [Pseudonocardia sp. EC080619-01]
MSHRFYGQVPQSDVENLPADLANKATLLHTHDDRYYTESETNTLLSAKANTAHNHDSQYYTIQETNDLAIYTPHGYYENSAGTVFSGASGSYRLIPFATNLGEKGVSRSSGNTVFTLGWAGRWSVEAGIRFAGAQANQTRYLAIVYPANTLGRYAENSTYQTGTGGSLSVSRVIPATGPNWTLGIGAISTGTSGFSVASDTSYTTFVSFTWLGPL